MRRPSFFSFTTIAGLAGSLCFGLPKPAHADSAQAAAECAALPAGAVAWWRAEGDASDAVASHDGVLNGGIRFEPGIVGQCFDLDGVNGFVQFESPLRSDNHSFTFEAWLNPSDVSTQRPIFEFANPSGRAGVHLWLSVRPTGGGSLPGTLYANIRDSFAGDHLISTSAGLITAGQWTHVALAYNAFTGRAWLFVNGEVRAEQQVGVFAPQTSLSLHLGRRPTGSLDGAGGVAFLGRIDEVSVYNRALSAAEIQAIYAAGAQGKCPPLYPTNDGISESWRLRYFGAGFRSDLRAAATADPDGDGANNFQEFLGGTDPLSGQDRPAVPLRVSTFAGSQAGHKDGYRTEAQFYLPSAAAVDRQGRLWVTEAYVTGFYTAGVGAHRVRLIESNGMVRTVAGAEEPGVVDGPASVARFSGPSAIVFDSAGNAYIGEWVSHRVRKIDSAGNVSTFAGSTAGYRDGVGTEAMLYAPGGLAIDEADNIYAAEFENGRIRRISPAGVVSTFAGTGERGARNGFRTEATFHGPHSLARTTDGTIYVADWGNGLIRKISPDGVVSTFVSGLQFVHAVAVDSSGNVYATIPPGSGHGLFKYRPDGSLAWSLRNGVGFEDGPAETAKFQFYGVPTALADGNLLVADSTAHRLRLVEVGVRPLLEVAPASGSFQFPLSVSLSTSVTNFSDGTVTIRYTVDGGVPTAAAPAYAAASPIVLTQPATVQARLFVNDNPVSDVVSATYTRVPPRLTLLPLATLFTNSLDVQITSTGLGPTDEIRYTLDGSDPVPSSPLYTRPIRLSAAATVKARAFRGGTPLTDVVSRTYARVYAVDDGISAEWRRRYFGDGYVTDPRVAANADPDGDGSTNLQEFAAGSDPTDPLSGFGVRGRLLPAVIWRSVPGQTYRILMKEKLDVTLPWTQVTEVTATEVESRYIDLNPDNAGKYFVVEPVR
jgi:sugar lactone lactonase YvrE